jgi:hypothetical protein
MWVMVSTLAQRNIKKDSDGSKMLSLATLLQNMHDELGEREICGASKGKKKRGGQNRIATKVNSVSFSGRNLLATSYQSTQ